MQLDTPYLELIINACFGKTIEDVGKRQAGYEVGWELWCERDNLKQLVISDAGLVMIEIAETKSK